MHGTRGGNTRLHSSVGENRLTLDVLLESGAGADVNARNANGETPLHNAARRSENILVGSLLELVRTRGHGTGWVGVRFTLRSCPARPSGR